MKGYNENAEYHIAVQWEKLEVMYMRDMTTLYNAKLENHIEIMDGHSRNCLVDFKNSRL